MQLEIAIALVLGFIIIYLIFVQIYAVLFRITGMTKEKAHFQTISLLTNSGYTTSESEIITDDKTRRKIAKGAMITGYAFSVIIVSLIINLLQNVSNITEEFTLKVTGIIFSVFVLVCIFLRLPFVRNFNDKTIEAIAKKLIYHKHGDNALTLLDIYGNDAIVEVYVKRVPDSLMHKTIFESQLKDKYRINILMLKRKGRVIEVNKNTVIQAGDNVVVFGRYQNIKDLFGKSVTNVEEALKTEHVKENIIELIDNYGEDAMAEITINTLPSILVGKTLIESKLKDDYKINVLMLNRSDIPNEITKDTIFKEHDKIVVFGPYSNIKNVFLYKENATK